jgi:hypothetical protein
MDVVSHDALTHERVTTDYLTVVVEPVVRDHEGAAGVDFGSYCLFGQSTVMPICSRAPVVQNLLDGPIGKSVIVVIHPIPAIARAIPLKC